MAKDQNQVDTLLGTSNADGKTPVIIKASPTAHSLATDDNTTGSDLSNDIASRDNNMVPVLIAVSSADGITPVAIYADANGQLLIKSS